MVATLRNVSLHRLSSESPVKGMSEGECHERICACRVSRAHASDHGTARNAGLHARPELLQGLPRGEAMRRQLHFPQQVVHEVAGLRLPRLDSGKRFCDGHEEKARPWAIVSLKSRHWRVSSEGQAIPLDRRSAQPPRTAAQLSKAAGCLIPIALIVAAGAAAGVVVVALAG